MSSAIPSGSVVDAAPTVRMAARIGAMHGVQPKAKARPRTNAEMVRQLVEGRREQILRSDVREKWGSYAILEGDLIMMMGEGMGGGMMIGMGLVWILIVVALILFIVALIKYLRK